MDGKQIKAQQKIQLLQMIYEHQREGILISGKTAEEQIDHITKHYQNAERLVFGKQGDEEIPDS